MKKIFILITLLSFNLMHKPVLADGHIKVLWETEKIFELPESAIYDKNDAMFQILQIIHLKRTVLDISLKIGLDGTVIEKNGLNHSTHLKG